MLKLARNILQKFGLRRLAEDTSGAEIAEAAAVLPLMFMVLLGIFWFGQAFRLYGTITRAAQDGARAGAAPYCTTCTGANLPPTNAVNAVNASLIASHLNPNNVSLQSPPTLNACGGGTVNTCQTVAGSNVCVEEPVLLSTPSSGAAGVCGIAVTFQYPYSFWLPFTSINNQQILLTASARVRIETQ
jgi:Flp pilus assembly protein TadG